MTDPTRTTSASRGDEADGRDPGAGRSVPPQGAPTRLHDLDRRGSRSGSHPRPSNARTVMVVTGLVLALMVAGAVTGVLLKNGGSTGVTPSQLGKVKVTLPAGQSSKLLPTTDARLMGIEKLDGKHAPNFTLTDQQGRTVSLSQLDRHHAVVLAFMDDRCTDICPIVAQELVDAYHDLGPQAQHVAFVSVNVNPGHAATSWLRSFIDAHGLTAIPGFRYMTGQPAALRSVWHHYGVTVKVAPSGKVYHSEAMYFIAPGGTMKYQATPYANLRKNGTGWLPTPTIAQWGRGIAHYAGATA